MKRLILFVSLFVCCTLVSPPLFAATITFDDFGPTYSGAVGTFTIQDVTFEDFFMGYDQIAQNYLAVDFGFGTPGTEMASINFANPVYLTGFDYFTTGVGCLLNYGGSLVSGGSSTLAQSGSWTMFDGGRAMIDESEKKYVDNIAVHDAPGPGAYRARPWLFPMSKKRLLAARC